MGRRVILASLAVWAASSPACAAPRPDAVGAGGGATVATSTSASSGSTSSSSSSSTAASSSSGGASALTGAIVYPDLARPWAGSVLVRPSGPVGAWSVDGQPLASPDPSHPELLLDTRALTDGVHTLSLQMLLKGTLQTVSGPIHVANGPAVSPPFTGTFVDITAAAGLSFPVMTGGGSSPPGAIAGDLDGDGDLDLLVWVPNQAQAQVYLQTAPLVFTPAGASISGYHMAAAMGDLDGDGLPDVVLVGAGIRILHNGGGSLIDVTAQSGIVNTPGALLDYHGVTVADIDNDGLLDVAVARLDCSADGPVPNLVLRNEGDMHFADIAPALGLDHPEARTFAHAIDRVAADGILHVWPFQDTCKQGPLPKHHRYADGPDLPVLVDALDPQEITAPMGSAMLDADGDGALDLFIAGCFNSPVYHAPALSGTIGPYVGLDAYPDPDGYFITAWSMATLDADLDGRADVFVTHHPSGPDGNVPGSRHALFWQKAKGLFADVAPLAGLSGFQPCRGALATDLDGDGDSDLLVGCLPQARVLRNDLVSPAAGRTLVFRGMVSNPEGVGALVTTPSGEQRLIRGGGNPFMGGVTRESVFAPSGSLQVVWPSGITQTVPVGAGPLVALTEPAVVALSARRVSAAAPAPVDVQVSPALLGDPGAAVTIDASTGVWTKPVAQHPDGIWRGTIQPPTGPATVVLAVTIGGTKLAVRPRIFVR